MSCLSERLCTVEGPPWARPLACFVTLAFWTGCVALPQYLPYARLDDPEAQRRVAEEYEHRGDRQEALGWYQKAAELDDTTSMLKAARMCGSDDLKSLECQSRWSRAALEKLTGPISKTYPEKTKAIEEMLALVQTLAEAGDIPSQKMLADLYATGRAVEVNQKMVASWLLKAAEQGDAQAQLSLAHRYFYAEEAVVVRPPGGGVPVVRDFKTVGMEESGLIHDNARAAFWAHKAAIQNLSEAKLFLAHIHSLGQGVALSAEEAERWFLEAAVQGNDEALFLLAQMYDDGVPKIRDAKRAARWYQKAAESGHREAQIRLAEMYFYGQGVERDRDAAGKWALLAAGLATSDERLQMFLAKGIRERFPALPTANEVNAASPHVDLDWEPVLFTRDKLARFPFSMRREWLVAAAQRGDVDAQIRLFLSHLDGEALPLQPDVFAALVLDGAETGSAPSGRLMAALHFLGLGVQNDYEKAVQWLERVSAIGHPVDALSLAVFHFIGPEEQVDDALAAQWIQKAVDLGSNAALRIAAAFHLIGTGVQKNIEKSVEMMRQAADAGDTEAQRIMAAMFQQGSAGLPKSDAEAARWLRKAALQDAGNTAAARVALAGLYYEGKGVAQSRPLAEQWLDKALSSSLSMRLDADAAAGCSNAHSVAVDRLFQEFLRRVHSAGDKSTLSLLFPTEDLPWLRRAAIQGFLPAQLFLAQRIAENSQEALRWYLVAANQGSLTAQLALKELFNFRFILQWTRDAAEQGDLSSQIELAEKYRFGEGLERDLVEAEKWYLRAATLDVETAIRIAEIYFSGEGILSSHGVCLEHAESPIERDCKWPQDKTKAAHLYQQAAERGHRGAQLTLARLYETGEGVSKSFESAVKWYRVAAEQGDLGAQLHLATAFEQGEKIDKNSEQAFKWYLKAAEQGDRNAQLRVAEMYEQGIGISSNQIESAHWYLKTGLNGGSHFEFIEKAAQLGDADAQYRMARAYSEGIGVDKDIEASIRYLQKAVAQGHVESERLLARAIDLGKGVPQDQAEAAQRYQLLLDRVENPVPLRLRLAEMYARGEGVNRDEAQALNWYLSIAEVSAEAQVRVAQMYREGTGVQKNSGEAAQRYLQLVRRYARSEDLPGKDACFQNMNKWEVISAVRLAEMHFDGEGVTQSIPDALHWVSLVLCSGQDKLFTGPDEKIEEFIEFLSRMTTSKMFAEKDARLLLARTYQGAAYFLEDSDKRTQAISKTLTWYRRAAEAGSLEAHIALSALYQRGGDGFPHDLRTSLKWCEKSLKIGEEQKWILPKDFFRPFESCELNDIYYALGKKGLSEGPRKTKDAIAWLTKAAQKDHTRSAVTLVHLYEGGRGVSKNPKEALKWIMKLAESGDLEMRLRLAQMYEKGGDGVAKDLKASFHWRRVASEGGDPDALRALARAYEQGIGVKKNFEKAFELYEKAFSKYKELYEFNPWLLLEMALMAESGQGLEKRDVQLASQYIDQLLKFLSSQPNELNQRPEVREKIQGILRRFIAQGDVSAREKLKNFSKKKSK